MLKELDEKEAIKNQDKKNCWLEHIKEWKSKRAMPVVDSDKLSPQTVIEKKNI